jgi:hypothetical protein
MATCPTCHQAATTRDGFDRRGRQRFACHLCHRDLRYVRAAEQNLPGSLLIRTGLHRLTGETTKPIERSHIATRDRLRASRGLKTTATGQRFLEGFEAVQALRRGDVALRCLVPGYRPQLATRGDRARAVAAAMVTLAAGLNKAA